MTGRRAPRPDRQRRYRSGQTAEWIAGAYLIARGHRILARRFKTSAGEIDLVTLKAGRLGFVEVKRRLTLADCEASITPRLRQRVRGAANQWMARNARYNDHDQGFDLLFIRPWRLPVYLPNAL